MIKKAQLMINHDQIAFQKQRRISASKPKKKKSNFIDSTSKSHNTMKKK